MGAAIHLWRVISELFFHRIADLSEKFIGIAGLVRTDVVDIEHGTVAFITIGIQSCDNGNIDLRNQIIHTLERTACHRDLRQRHEFHVLGFKKSDGAKARFCPAEYTSSPLHSPHPVRRSPEPSQVLRRCRK